MCNLCSNDPEQREAAKKTMRREANQLRRLADKYDQMADGKLNPHSKESKDVGYLARHVVRELVEEWV